MSVSRTISRLDLNLLTTALLIAAMSNAVVRRFRSSRDSVRSTDMKQSIRRVRDYRLNRVPNLRIEGLDYRFGISWL